MKTPALEPVSLWEIACAMHYGMECMERFFAFVRDPLSATTAVPCISQHARHLFCKESPGRWFPRGAKTRVLYHRTECAGCGLELCEHYQKKCIPGISVDEVFSVPQELIESSIPSNCCKQANN